MLVMTTRHSMLPEFIHLIASEANEICEKEAKKTIAAEHVITALQVWNYFAIIIFIQNLPCILLLINIINQTLGFENYLSEVQEVFKEHKKLQKVKQINLTQSNRPGKAN